MKFGIYSAEGDRRITNEDFVIADQKLGIYIVCDGMGGHAAGEYASLQAGNYLLDFLRAELSDDLSEMLVFDVLNRAIDGVNRHVYGLSRSDEAYYGMGTTALIAYIAGKQLYICHVGDSRAYLVDDERALLLTRDQSYVQKLVDEGQISEEEARVHPKRNIVLQAVGTNQALQPELLAFDLAANQVVVLCSDGISDALTEEDMYRIIGEAKSAENAAKMLVEKAFLQGSKDDASAIVIGSLPLNRVNI
ncbi:MAG: hypothetical protein CSA13_02210 [Clostridiales bacterium]|nr:MAG: hypothetical protein CSA13_02210 [Clostridiales bacterium]